MRFIFIMFIVAMVAGSFAYIYYHEQTHAEIFRAAGDNDVQFGVDFKHLAAVTYGSCYESKECESAQVIADTYGYHQVALILNLWLIAFVFMLIAFENHRKGGETKWQER